MLDATPSEHRDLPQPAYDLAVLLEGESSISLWVASSLLHEFRADHDSNLEWQIHWTAWSVLLDLVYSKEEIFALWCHFYPWAQSLESGLDQAAKLKYGKNLSSLDLSQTAHLIVMARAPEYYASNSEKLTARVTSLIDSYEQK